MNRSARKRRNTLHPALYWYGLPVAGLLVAVWATLSLSLLAPAPPRNQDDLCEIFREQPGWYDYAAASETRWGTPIATQMAFVYYESSFRSHAQPPRTKLWGVIPWVRSSSAYGYAQALDPTWGDYLNANGKGLFVVRTHIKHALDFIGWYNHLTHRHLDIPLTDAQHLYLAYHEGRTGYRRGTYNAKPAVARLARRVASRARQYNAQLGTCEQEFQCWRFYQFWPFCGD
ncbi:lysozyme-like domain containing protein [Marinobacter sp. X15-166B]|uniref:transglycosylase SLT domain-containing protein n=1 Tax=Marinobacter sp. X15-166B TaxID=1897620 RepID=UPI00085BE0F0|nr:lysozyme-like domain containing protein [Marinobacter sp. X15-166B]OEY65342.1 lysozyme-like domain containing protein [Marinobacter sp. X15-166B]